MISVILVVIIVTVVAVFSVQNASPVGVSFLSWHFEASLAIVIFLALLSGLIIGVAVMSWSRMKRLVKEKKASDRRTSEFR